MIIEDIRFSRIKSNKKFRNHPIFKIFGVRYIKGKTSTVRLLDYAIQSKGLIIIPLELLKNKPEYNIRGIYGDLFEYKSNYHKPYQNVAPSMNVHLSSFVISCFVSLLRSIYFGTHRGILHPLLDILINSELQYPVKNAKFYINFMTVNEEENELILYVLAQMFSEMDQYIYDHIEVMKKFLVDKHGKLKKYKDIIKFKKFPNVIKRNNLMQILCGESKINENYNDEDDEEKDKVISLKM